MKTRLSILLIALLANTALRAAELIAPQPSLDSDEVQMSCSYPNDPHRINDRCADYVRTQRLNRLMGNVSSKEMKAEAQALLAHYQILPRE